MAEKTKSSGFVPIASVVVLIILGFMLFGMTSGRSGSELDKSPIGVNGLTPWLQSKDLKTVVSHPRLSPPAESFGLRILPIYDIDMDNEAGLFTKREDRISAKTLRDIWADNFYTKISEIPTVVLLPKWNGAMRELEIAHEQSLLAIEDVENLLEQMELGSVSVMRTGPEFTMPPDPAIFQAQLFKRSGNWPKGCREIFGLKAGALILQCKSDDNRLPVVYVSDPDLMNNHGLAVAENAGLLPDLLAGLFSDDRPKRIYVDLSSELLTSFNRDDERQDYTRGREDYAKIFTYPLSLFWASLLIILAILIWRGAKRFGPLSLESTEHLKVKSERSKNYSLGAKARLLRLSGHDGQILSDFVRGQMTELARRLFGPDEQLRGPDRLITLLARRDAELAAEFETLSRQLIDEGANMSRHVLYSHFTRYQSLRKKVLETYGTS